MNTHRYLPSILTAILFFAIVSRGIAADYEKKISFKPHQAITFPGFVLTYLGDRRVTSEHFPRGFLYFDFRVEAGREQQTVSWTSGTGDIGPAAFQIDGHRYMLELRISDKLGRLKEDELVITRE